jgi:hypoxanthine-DNA glycosylase
MIETNPFRYFIPQKPKLLILGSFPCFNGKDYGDWFYSGSGRNHFWKLLSDSLGMPALNRKEKQTLCERYGIALSDIAYKIKRKKGDCSDANLHILELNQQGIQKCLDSGIQKVLFTSRFVERHFKRMFPVNSIDTEVLTSPSPAANMHIGGLDEYKKLRSSGRINSPYEYRLMKYRKILGG